jgi:hypothetical protein
MAKLSKKYSPLFVKEHGFQNQNDEQCERSNTDLFLIWSESILEGVENIENKNE